MFFSFLNIKNAVFPVHYTEMKAVEVKFLSGKGPDLYS
jgi:hypothetical protein